MVIGKHLDTGPDSVIHYKKRKKMNISKNTLRRSTVNLLSAQNQFHIRVISLFQNSFINYRNQLNCNILENRQYSIRYIHTSKQLLWSRGLGQHVSQPIFKKLRQQYHVKDEPLSNAIPFISEASTQNTKILTDIDILKRYNTGHQYEQAILYFESLYPSSTLLQNSLNTIDSRLIGEYIKALSNSHQLHKLNPQLVSSSQPKESNATTPEFRLRLDTTSQPLKVTLKDGFGSGAFLKEMLKYGITVLLSIAALSIVFERLAANLPKGLGFGGSKKVNAVTNITTTFDDVKGYNEVKDELKEIIEYLTDPDKFTRLGAKLPKGVLLAGPPGTGKTLIARAIAGEANVPFIQSSGSEFEEMFVGVGARRVRDLFAAARKMGPAIVFIDEIDAVGSKRVNKENTSVRMTLNQLLVELDGFEQNEGVVVICATNFPESLDSALTRPGRLDKIVTVPLPDLQGRQEILELYGSRVKLDKDVDLSVLARRTVGMTGADLSNIINIAAVKSSSEDKLTIPMNALENAYDRVVVGLERRNPMSDEEKRMTAYHEAGHTLVSWHSKSADPIHKATIMPRGSALGVTWQIPEKDRYQQTLEQLETRLDVLMGGKAAEVFIFGNSNATSGCSSDLQAATQLARQMVMQFGMGVENTKVPMYIDSQTYGALSNDLRSKIDTSVQNLLDAAYTRASAILGMYRNQLENVSNALVEYETLNSAEIKMAIEGNITGIGVSRMETHLKAQKSKDSRSLKLLKHFTSSDATSTTPAGSSSNHSIG